MITLYDFQAILQISVVAVVFCDILTREGELFDFYGRWLDSLEIKYPKLAKPLGYCVKCFAGQIAAWYFILFVGFEIVRFVSFVSTTILCAYAISLALDRLRR